VGPREGVDGFGEGKMSCPCRYLYCRPTSVWHSRCTDYAPGVENIQYFSKLQLSSAVLFIIFIYFVYLFIYFFYLFIYFVHLFIYLFCLFIYLFCLYLFCLYLFILSIYLYILSIYLFILSIYLFIYFTKAIVVGVKYKVI
jgi:hypothetical protein